MFGKRHVLNDLEGLAAVDHVVSAASVVFLGSARGCHYMVVLLLLPSHILFTILQNGSWVGVGLAVVSNIQDCHVLLLLLLYHLYVASIYPERLAGDAACSPRGHLGSPAPLDGVSGALQQSLLHTQQAAV